MIPRLGYDPSRSTASPDPKRQQILQHRPAPGGIAARAQSAVQARGPLPGARAATDAPASPLRLFDSVPASVAIDPYAPASSAGATGDVAAARPGHLVSGGATFPSTSPNEEEREEHDDASDCPLTTTRGRYDLRHRIARMLRPADGTKGPAVCGCGRAGHEVDDVAVHLSAEGRAYATGVYRCDSAVLCPTCSPRRAFEIQERLTRAVQACVARGGSVWFVTPTVRRKRNQPLAAMRSGFQEAFRTARQGKGWVGPAKQAGVLGVSGVVEAPWSSQTGWGLHGHYLVFFDHRESDRALEACKLLIGRFLARLPEYGLSGTWSAQDAEECVDAEKAAKYCGKIASELAHGWVKKSRKEKSTSVHPFALAAKASMEGVDVPSLERVSPARCRELWLEYAAAMKGIRLGVISSHLAKKLGIASAEDNEKPGLRQLLEDERIDTIETPTWNRLVGRGRVGEFFARIESSVRLDEREDMKREYEGWQEVRAWALEAGAEDRPGDDEFLRRDPSRPASRPPSPADLQASAAADRMMALRRVVSVVRSSTGTGTLDTIRRAAAADAAAHPGIALTETEVIQALPNAA